MVRPLGPRGLGLGFRAARVRPIPVGISHFGGVARGEQEITTILKLVQEIRAHIGIASQQHDIEIERQLMPTDVQRLSTELDQHLPNE
jgi:hypothetical protein